MTPIPADIAAMLDAEAARINSPEFIADDPVQFPRLYDALPDIEIAAILSSSIAWGNRKMICRDCSRLLAMMDHQPHAFVMDEAYEELPDEGNIHRTFFNRNLKNYLRALRRVYARYPSLHDWLIAAGVPEAEAPAWRLAELLNAELAAANGCHDSRCLPSNLDSTALKRLNMMMRWLARRDGIVDLGVWTAIDPAKLFIPLDTHVAATSRHLGILSRRSNDRRAVQELTDNLRALRPHDPAIYDYALFGIGMKL